MKKVAKKMSMKKYEASKVDKKVDKKMGYKEGSKKDMVADRKAMKLMKAGKSAKQTISLMLKGKKK